MLAEIADDLAQLPRPVVCAGTHRPPLQPAVLRTDRDDAKQRRLDGELTAGRLLLPCADDLREQRAHLALPRLARPQTGREPQPSLRERLEQSELGLVGTGELQKIRREDERAELVFSSGSAYLMQLLGRREEYVSPGALVHPVRDRQRDAAAVHRNDLQLGMPVIRDEIAVIRLAPVERRIDLKRKGKRAVLLLFASCRIHRVSSSRSGAVFPAAELLKIVLFVLNLLQAFSRQSAIIIIVKGTARKSAAKLNRIFVVSYVKRGF